MNNISNIVNNCQKSLLSEQIMNFVLSANVEIQFYGILFSITYPIRDQVIGELYDNFKIS